MLPLAAFAAAGATLLLSIPVLAAALLLKASVLSLAAFAAACAPLLLPSTVLAAALLLKASVLPLAAFTVVGPYCFRHNQSSPSMISAVPAGVFGFPAALKVGGILGAIGKIGLVGFHIVVSLPPAVVGQFSHLKPSSLLLLAYIVAHIQY